MLLKCQIWTFLATMGIILAFIVRSDKISTSSEMFLSVAIIHVSEQSNIRVLAVHNIGLWAFFLCKNGHTIFGILYSDQNRFILITRDGVRVFDTKCRTFPCDQGDITCMHAI